MSPKEFVFSIKQIWQVVVIVVAVVVSANLLQYRISVLEEQQRKLQGDVASIQITVEHIRTLVEKNSTISFNTPTK